MKLSNNTVDKENRLLHFIFGNNKHVECDRVFEIIQDIPCLTDRERIVILERFSKNYTLQQIADAHNVTRERARQIENKALGKLRLGKYAKTFIENKTWAEIEAEVKEKIEQNIRKNYLPEETLAESLGTIVDDISVRAYNALRRARIKTMHDLRNVILDKPIIGDETGYRDIRNLGIKSRKEVLEAAIRHGIVLEKEIPNGKGDISWTVAYLKC